MGAGLITAEVIEGGLGRHGYYLQSSQLRIFAAMGWADWIQTFITLMFTKISICLFLLRIVDGRKIRMGIYLLIGFLVLFTTISTCLFLGICRPLKAHWNVGIEGVCLSDKMIENIVMAQGSMLAPFQIIGLAKLMPFGSPLYHYGSHMRRLPYILLARLAGQAQDQDSLVHPNGFGCNVRNFQSSASHLLIVDQYRGLLHSTDGPLKRCGSTRRHVGDIGERWLAPSRSQHWDCLRKCSGIATFIPLLSW